VKRYGMNCCQRKLPRRKTLAGKGGECLPGSCKSEDEVRQWDREDAVDVLSLLEEMQKYPYKRFRDAPRRSARYRLTAYLEGSSR